jgi:sec-independent protein translocase protein TatC
MLNDKRRRLSNPDAELSDDEASHLDLTPESLEEPESVSPGRPALPERVSSAPDHVNGYDDIT